MVENMTKINGTYAGNGTVYREVPMRKEFTRFPNRLYILMHREERQDIVTSDDIRDSLPDEV